MTHEPHSVFQRQGISLADISFLVTTSSFRSPHGIPGKCIVRQQRQEGKQPLGGVCLFPWFLRSLGQGRKRNLGTESKSTILFSFRCINMHRIPPGKGDRLPWVIRSDFAWQGDIAWFFFIGGAISSKWPFSRPSFPMEPVYNLLLEISGLSRDK